MSLSGKVHAVPRPDAGARCVSSARGDLCGGGEQSRRPYGDAALENTRSSVDIAQKILGLFWPPNPVGTAQPLAFGPWRLLRPGVAAAATSLKELVLNGTEPILVANLRAPIPFRNPTARCPCRAPKHRVNWLGRQHSPSVQPETPIDVCVDEIWNRISVFGRQVHSLRRRRAWRHSQTRAGAYG